MNDAIEVHGARFKMQACFVCVKGPYQDHLYCLTSSQHTYAGKSDSMFFERAFSSFPPFIANTPPH
jgi:hypothetical protein